MVTVPFFANFKLHFYHCGQCDGVFRGRGHSCPRSGFAGVKLSFVQALLTVVEHCLRVRGISDYHQAVAAFKDPVLAGALAVDVRAGLTVPLPADPKFSLECTLLRLFTPDKTPRSQCTPEWSSLLRATCLFQVSAMGECPAATVQCWCSCLCCVAMWMQCTSVQSWSTAVVAC
jgi:hypothetical protein